MMKEKLKKIKNWIYSNLVLLFLLLAAIFILLSKSSFLLNYPSWANVSEKLGYAVFSSGVFAAVLKSIQFTGIFKEEIEKVILGTDFIEKRSDLDILWKKVSQSIYKSKFPKISDDLENRILQTYFPTNSDFYYEDYTVTVNIEKITDEFEIFYTQTCKYTVIPDRNIENIELVVKMSIDDVNGSKIVNDLEFFKVNGEEKVINEDPETEDDTHSKNFKIPLTGKGPFLIHSKYRRQYSLRSENYKLFRVLTFTKNMDVIISYPEDVCVSFFNIGNVNFFEKQHVEVKNIISRSHRNDLILPYQGFGMSFEKN